MRTTLLCAVLVVGCRHDDTDSDTDTDTDTDTDDTDSPPPGTLWIVDSFESPVLDPGGYDQDVHGYWYVQQSGGAVGHLRPLPGSLADIEPLAPPADGNQTLWLHASGDGGVASGWSGAERILGGSTGGTTYTARVALGRRLDIADVDVLHVTLGVGGPGDADLVVYPSVALPRGAYAEVEVLWACDLASGGLPMTIAFVATSAGPSTGNRQVLVDNIRIWADAAD